MESDRKNFLTLDPDKESNPAFADPVPAMQAVVPAETMPTDVAAGAIDESMLNQEEREMVNQFASEIDISNVDQIVKYGSAAQRNISDFSVSVLRKVKTLDLGEVGDSLKELTVALDATVEPEK